MHFFNPPRYMHLVELIRTEWTRPEVSCSMFGFLDERLGKGVVVAKDRPNFIANRIGTFGALVTIRTMLDDGYSIEEVDKITGPAVGRPKTATFRTFDLVGLDVFAHVVKNLHENLPDDPEREMFVMPEFVTKMIEGGLLGNKSKAGFYMKDTLIPLSIAFIDANGTIVDIQDMQPQTTDVHYSEKPYRYAVEANQGWYGEKGIVVGDKVEVPIDSQ